MAQQHSGAQLPRSPPFPVLSGTPEEVRPLPVGLNWEAEEVEEKIVLRSQRSSTDSIDSSSELDDALFDSVEMDDFGDDGKITSAIGETEFEDIERRLALLPVLVKQNSSLRQLWEKEREGNQLLRQKHDFFHNEMETLRASCAAFTQTNSLLRICVALYRIETISGLVDFVAEKVPEILRVNACGLILRDEPAISEEVRFVMEQGKELEKDDLLFVPLRSKRKGVLGVFWLERMMVHEDDLQEMCEVLPPVIEHHMIRDELSKTSSVGSSQLATTKTSKVLFRFVSRMCDHISKNSKKYLVERQDFQEVLESEFETSFGDNKENFGSSLNEKFVAIFELLNDLRRSKQSLEVRAESLELKLEEEKKRNVMGSEKVNEFLKWVLDLVSIRSLEGLKDFCRDRVRAIILNPSVDNCARDVGVELVGLEEGTFVREFNVLSWDSHQRVMTMKLQTPQEIPAMTLQVDLKSSTRENINGDTLRLIGHLLESMLRQLAGNLNFASFQNQCRTKEAKLQRDIGKAEEERKLAIRNYEALLELRKDELVKLSESRPLSATHACQQASECVSNLFHNLGKQAAVKVILCTETLTDSVKVRIVSPVLENSEKKLRIGQGLVGSCISTGSICSADRSIIEQQPGLLIKEIDDMQAQHVTCFPITTYSAFRRNNESFEEAESVHGCFQVTSDSRCDGLVRELIMFCVHSLSLQLEILHFHELDFDSQQGHAQARGDLQNFIVDLAEMEWSSNPEENLCALLTEFGMRISFGEEDKGPFEHRRTLEVRGTTAVLSAPEESELFNLIRCVLPLLLNHLSLLRSVSETNASFDALEAAHVESQSVLEDMKTINDRLEKVVFMNAVFAKVEDFEDLKLKVSWAFDDLFEERFSAELFSLENVPSMFDSVRNESTFERDWAGLRMKRRDFAIILRPRNGNSMQPNIPLMENICDWFDFILDDCLRRIDSIKRLRNLGEDLGSMSVKASFWEKVQLLLNNLCNDKLFGNRDVAEYVEKEIWERFQCECKVREGGNPVIDGASSAPSLSRDELDTVQTLARLIMSVFSASEASKAKTRAEIYRKLSSIRNALLHQNDEQTYVELVCRLVEEHLSVECCICVQTSDDVQEFSPFGTVEHFVSPYSLQLCLKGGGRAVPVDELRSIHLAISPAIQAQHVLAVPISIPRKLALIIVNKRSGSAFDETDRLLIDEIAHETASAILTSSELVAMENKMEEALNEQARLQNELEQVESSQECAKLRSDAGMLLKKVAEELSTSWLNIESPKHLCEFVQTSSLIRQVLRDAESCRLFWRNSEDMTMMTLEGDVVVPICKIGEGLVGKCAEAGEFMKLADPYSHLSYLARADALGLPRNPNLLSLAPIKSCDSLVLAVFAVAEMDPEYDEIFDELVHLLSLACNIIDRAEQVVRMKQELDQARHDLDATLASENESAERRFRESQDIDIMLLRHALVVTEGNTHQTKELSSFIERAFEKTLLKVSIGTIDRNSVNGPSVFFCSGDGRIDRRDLAEFAKIFENIQTGFFSSSSLETAFAIRDSKMSLLGVLLVEFNQSSTHLNHRFSGIARLIGTAFEFVSFNGRISERVKDAQKEAEISRERESKFREKAADLAGKLERLVRRHSMERKLVSLSRRIWTTLQQDKKRLFRVLERGLEDVFNEIIENPRVELYVVSDNQVLQAFDKVAEAVFTSGKPSINSKRICSPIHHPTEGNAVLGALDVRGRNVGMLEENFLAEVLKFYGLVLAACARSKDAATQVDSIIPETPSTGVKEKSAIQIMSKALSSGAEMISVNHICEILELLGGLQPDSVRYVSSGDLRRGSLMPEGLSFPLRHGDESLGVFCFDKTNSKLDEDLRKEVEACLQIFASAMRCLPHRGSMANRDLVAELREKLDLIQEQDRLMRKLVDKSSIDEKRRVLVEHSGSCLHSRYHFKSDFLTDSDLIKLKEGVTKAVSNDNQIAIICDLLEDPRFRAEYDRMQISGSGQARFCCFVPFVGSFGRAMLRFWRLKPLVDHEVQTDLRNSSLRLQILVLPHLTWKSPERKPRDLECTLAKLCSGFLNGSKLKETLQGYLACHQCDILGAVIIHRGEVNHMIRPEEGFSRSDIKQVMSNNSSFRGSSGKLSLPCRTRAEKNDGHFYLVGVLQLKCPLGMEAKGFETLCDALAHFMLRTMKERVMQSKIKGYERRFNALEVSLVRKGVGRSRGSRSRLSSLEGPRTDTKTATENQLDRNDEAFRRLEVKFDKLQAKLHQIETTGIQDTLSEIRPVIKECPAFTDTPTQRSEDGSFAFPFPSTARSKISQTTVTSLRELKDVCDQMRSTQVKRTAALQELIRLEHAQLDIQEGKTTSLNDLRKETSAD